MIKPYRITLSCDKVIKTYRFNTPEEGITFLRDTDVVQEFVFVSIKSHNLPKKYEKTLSKIRFI